jgi:hypothetical protein
MEPQFPRTYSPQLNRYPNDALDSPPTTITVAVNALFYKEEELCNVLI